MDGENYWVEEYKNELPFPLKRKRNVKLKKLEFVGWGSKRLMEFLESIGKDTSKTYSQKEVATIVTEYVNLNSLLNPQKKKRVMCDERLHSLFGKKSIPRIKIYDLLEVHFSENHEESDDDASNSSEEEGEILVESKGRQNTVSPKKKVPAVPKSCFAAVIAENIKLVYLKRSLVLDLLKSPGSSRDKILGCYVRVKSDPNDYLQKNSHQLQQVEGVREVPATSDAAFENHLQLSNATKEISISSISDDEFSKEELEDLHERIKAGLLKRPTFLELELKAQVLHKDITKHSIEREIALLQKRIDHANEKGWRRQMFEYLERKQLLQTQKEQDRLLSTMPKVVAEELEREVITVDAPEGNEEEEKEERGNDCSPKSILNGATDKSGARDAVIPSSRDFVNGDTFIAVGNGDTVIPSSRAFVNGDTFIADGNGDTVIPSNRAFVNGDTFIADGNDKHADMIQEHIDTTLSLKTQSSKEIQAEVSKQDIVSQETRAQATQTVVLSKTRAQVTPTEVIDLSDDDSDIEVQKNVKQASRITPEDAIWFYRDPQGNRQGPFSLTTLKRWSDDCYFEPSFRVWMAGQSEGDSVLLTEAFRHFFPAK